MSVGLSGLEVLEALNRMHRDVPVLLMTAFSDGSVSAMAGKLGAVGVLHKPFDFDDLLTAVYNARKVVDARRARASSPMPLSNHEVEATPPPKMTEDAVS